MTQGTTNDCSQRLHGRLAVVTGAGAGMGAAITRRFLEEGAIVVAADIDSSALERLSADLGPSPRLVVVTSNVSSPEGADAIAAKAMATTGFVDVLVNNAGIYPSKSFETMTFDDWRSVIDVNLHGVFLVTKALFPLMKAQGSGRIINIGSSSFFVGTPNASHYIASKGGVIGLSRSLASELGRYGITVNVVTPGLTMTETVRRKTAPELIEMRRKQRPLGRDQMADDIVGAVLFLASADAAFITGQIINVDGGIVKH
jgi:NAD(P)-dependent dehydrogenase (short-subunit alcohol dehydrogenase family)